MKGSVKGMAPALSEGAAALVGVNVVRPAGRSTLTPRARRDMAAAGATACGAGWGSLSVPPGGLSGLSQRCLSLSTRPLYVQVRARD